MVNLTVRGEILNIRTSLAPHTNEFRFGKLESKLQTYLALLQASLLGAFQRMFLALHVCCRYPEVVNPSSIEAKWPRLSTWYKVMESPSVLDGARHCRPAELDVKLVHGTWAQVECHLPFLWTVLRHSSPRCEGISPGPLSSETGHMISCSFIHTQLASMLIYRIPDFLQHSE